MNMSLYTDPEYPKCAECGCKVLPAPFGDRDFQGYKPCPAHPNAMLHFRPFELSAPTGRLWPEAGQIRPNKMYAFFKRNAV